MGTGTSGKEKESATLKKEAYRRCTNVASGQHIQNKSARCDIESNTMLGVTGELT